MRTTWLTVYTTLGNRHTSDSSPLPPYRVDQWLWFRKTLVDWILVRLCNFKIPNLRTSMRYHTSLQTERTRGRYPGVLTTFVVQVVFVWAFNHQAAVELPDP